LRNPGYSDDTESTISIHAYAALIIDTKKNDNRYCVNFTFMVSLISTSVIRIGGISMRASLIRNSLNIIVALLLCLALIALPLATMVKADSIKIVNAGFENGDLSGWTVGSTNGTVEALQAANFIPSISPTKGSWFVLLSSHS